MSQTALGILLMLVCLFMALGFLLIFVWAVRDGRFRDIEGIKYRMLAEDNKFKSEAETLPRETR